MTPIIRAALSNLLGEEAAKDIDIVSNDVDIQPNGQWKIKFRHPTRQVIGAQFVGKNSLIRYAAFMDTTSRAPFCLIAIFLIRLSSSSSVMAYQVRFTLILRIIPVLHSFTDMSAAKHADVLFVKHKGSGENDLASYCTREGIRHILFEDFSKALPIVQSVVTGEKTVDQVLTAGKMASLL